MASRRKDLTEEKAELGCEIWSSRSGVAEASSRLVNCYWRFKSNSPRRIVCAPDKVEEYISLLGLAAAWGGRMASKPTFRVPMTRTEMVLEMFAYSPFDHLTDAEVRDGPRNVGLLAFRPAYWCRGQRWSSKCWFTRHSSSWLMTRSEMVLEMLVY